MRNLSSRIARKIGRPPAGIGGAKVAEYPQISLRVPPHVRDLLGAVSEVRGQPHWRIMMDALDAYVSALPPEERSIVENMVRNAMPRGVAGE
jgi:hypothetical protein